MTYTVAQSPLLSVSPNIQSLTQQQTESVRSSIITSVQTIMLFSTMLRLTHVSNGLKYDINGALHKFQTVVPKVIKIIREKWRMNDFLI